MSSVPSAAPAEVAARRVELLSESGLRIPKVLVQGGGGKRWTLEEDADGLWTLPEGALYPLRISAPGHQEIELGDTGASSWVLPAANLLLVRFSGVEAADIDAVEIESNMGPVLDALSRCALTGFSDGTTWAMAIEPGCYGGLTSMESISVLFRFSDGGRASVSYDLHGRAREVVSVSYLLSRLETAPLEVHVQGLPDADRNVEILIGSRGDVEAWVEETQTYTLRIEGPSTYRIANLEVPLEGPLSLGEIPSGQLYFIRARSRSSNRIGGREFLHTGEVVELRLLGPLSIRGRLVAGDQPVPDKAKVSVAWDTGGGGSVTADVWSSEVEREVEVAPDGSFELRQAASVLRRAFAPFPASGVVQVVASGFRSPRIMIRPDEAGASDLGDVHLQRWEPDFSVRGLRLEDPQASLEDAPVRFPGLGPQDHHVVEHAAPRGEDRVDVYLLRDHSAPPHALLLGRARGRGELPSPMPSTILLHLNKGIDGGMVVCRRVSGSSYVAEEMRVVSAQIVLSRPGDADDRVLLGWESEGLLGVSASGSRRQLAAGLPVTFTLPATCSLWWQVAGAEERTAFTLAEPGEVTRIE